MDLQVNDDGSVDVYVGPKPPEGKESNWVQTIPGRAGSVTSVSMDRSKPTSTALGFCPIFIRPSGN
jgi:hypothetical protein